MGSALIRGQVQHAFAQKGEGGWRGAAGQRRGDFDDWDGLFPPAQP